MKALLISVGMVWASLSMAAVQTIRVTDVNQPFAVEMPENRTTGYIWFLSAYDANIITPIDKSYTAAASQLAGAPGVASWRFNSCVHVPTITKVRFSAQRPWAVSDQAQSAEYTVVILPSDTAKNAQ